MSKIARDNRNREIAQIQIGKAELARMAGMTTEQYDEIYRDTLFTLARVRSAKDLDHAGRQAVLKFMRDRGVTFRSPGGAKRSAAYERRPQPTKDKLAIVRRIRAQLISLDRKPNTYADGVLKQAYGDAAPQYYEWATHEQLYKLSAMLRAHQVRTGAPTE